MTSMGRMLYVRSRATGEGPIDILMGLTSKLAKASSPCMCAEQAEPLRLTIEDNRGT